MITFNTTCLILGYIIIFVFGQFVGWFSALMQIEKGQIIIRKEKTDDDILEEINRNMHKLMSKNPRLSNESDNEYLQRLRILYLQERHKYDQKQLF